MNPASKFRAVALLDRDGTIIEDVDYLSDPSQVRLLPRAAQAIRLLNDEDVACVVTSNQSGVARGFFDEGRVRAANERMSAMLREEAGARLDAVFVSTGAPDSGDLLRKPARGMYDLALAQLPIAELPVFAIGDKGTDIEFAHNCGGLGIAVRTGKGAPGIVAGASVRVAADLFSAAEILLTELLRSRKRHDETFCRKLWPMNALAEELDRQRAAGKRIVLANGCFDLLHGGHISYLEASRERGDLLVLAVNSNRSIRALKGEGRPILAEDDRLQMLAALEAVDYLTLFYDDTADRALETLRPHMHAKGTDYTSANVPERLTAQRLGVETVITGNPKENSTRDIITVVRERAARGVL